jgi:hypothetical protein
VQIFTSFCIFPQNLIDYLFYYLYMYILLNIRKKLYLALSFFYLIWIYSLIEFLISRIWFLSFVNIWNRSLNHFSVKMMNGLSYVTCISIDLLTFISTPNINVISLRVKSSTQKTKQNKWPNSKKKKKNLLFHLNPPYL